MIRLACKIPSKVVLACSGGRDSMSALEFLIRGRREVTVAHFNHGTTHGEKAHKFLKNFCLESGLDFIAEVNSEECPKGMSKELFWREKRYDFFQKFSLPIVMAHHLDDAVEWWIFSSLRGNPNLIPVTRADPGILRPFLFSTKSDIHRILKEYPHIEDPSNLDLSFARNFIRHELGPMCLNLNPGLKKTVRNLYEKLGV
jgi:tRNA(Ile)-lysidine synthase